MIFDFHFKKSQLVRFGSFNLYISVSQAFLLMEHRKGFKVEKEPQIL